MNRVAGVDRYALRCLWKVGRSSWSIRVAVLLAVVAVLLIAYAAFGQSGVERDLDRLERQIEQLKQANEESAKVRLAGFERLATIEATVAILTRQVARMENVLFGTIAGLLANFLASLKTISDLRVMRGRGDDAS